MSKGKGKSKYDLGDRVMSTTNQRAGTVTARTEFLEGEPMYQVEHDSVVERQPIRDWYGEHALVDEETPAQAPAGAAADTDKVA